MQNEVLKAINERRSIRAYTPDRLTDEQKDILVRAALEAPSAVNRQPYHFTFVQSAETLSAFRNEAARLLKAQRPDMPEDFDILRGAPCVCFVFADTENTWSPIDTGIAVENMALAAHSIGLGSVILGMPRAVFEANGDTWKPRLECPDGYEFCVAIAFGVPAGTKEAHPVREGLVSFID